MRSFMFSVSACALAAVGAAAAPLNVRAAGPSGKVLSPDGGSTIEKGLPLWVDYMPVEAVDPSSGQKTTAVSVDLIQGSTVVALGGLPTDLSNTPSDQQVYPNQYFPFDDSFTRQGFACGDWNVQITDFQEGPVFNGSFVAAAPLVHFAC